MADVVLEILQELKLLISEAHGKWVEQQARIAKRRQEIKSASPSPPATFLAEKEKLSRSAERDGQVAEKRRSGQNGEWKEPWDLLKLMEGIKFVSGWPLVKDTLLQRTKLEFK
jgi:hypothetical protein